MSGRDFIVDKLNDLSKSNNKIKIRYEYSSLTSTHIIEVLPLYIFENDIDFIIKEVRIQDEFEELFGDKEEILFISDGYLTTLENPELIIGY